MAKKGNAEYVIEDVAGCGPFQVMILIFVVLLSNAAMTTTLLFMSFGNYNPGWRCLDNNLTGSSADNFKDNVTNLEYTEGSCGDYNQCQNVEFDPETSTLVTEWGLLCDKEWIISIIISMQMVGMLIGSLIGGQLADLFGRKIIFYCSVFSCAVLHLISSFSVSWPMFIVIRFLLGMFTTCIVVLVYIYISEFMTLNCRATVMPIPFWYIGSIMLALIAMGFKDWRQVERVSCAIYVILFIPIFWVPESLRWLEVKGKTKDFDKVAQKVVKFNRKTLTSFEELAIGECYDNTDEDKKYSILDLFRPGLKFQTFSIGFLQCVFSLIFYALSFGVKSFYGDFYINMIIPNAVAFIFCFFGMIALRYVRRIRTSLFFMGSSIVFSFGAVGCLLSSSKNAKEIGSTALISIVKGTMDVSWYILYARITEMYPTVIRSTALGYASLSSRIGGIVAPFVIPGDKQQLYIFIIVSAVVMLFCCFLSYKLPETKGKLLRETFDDVPKKGLMTMGENLGHHGGGRVTHNIFGSTGQVNGTGQPPGQV